MKRTPLVRKSPLKKRRAGKPRRGRDRDPKYMRWVKSFPCCACGRVGNSDPAHTNALGRGGMDLKTSDRSVIPLCRPCHGKFDHGQHRLTFEADHGISIAAIVAKFNTLYQTNGGAPMK